MRRRAVTSSGRGADALTELRDAFDRAFSEAPGTGAPDAANVLALAAGAESYLVRMAEVSGLFADKNITRLPGSVPELLGIAGFRGTILPVYDLAMLLGVRRTGRPRWLITAGAAPLALAFERFDGYVQAPGGDVLASGSNDVRQHVREVVRTADVQRPLISLASVVDQIRQLAATDRQE
jgi:purine-binding chemotaxis protein CheW